LESAKKAGIAPADATTDIGAAKAADAAAPDAAKGAADAATDAAKDAPAAADAAAGEATAKATELINQITTYVKDNKLDLADKAVVQLEALKPQLPASYHGKIDSAKSMVDAAKKGQGLKGLLPK
jgi:hypothetical protein